MTFDVSPQHFCNCHTVYMQLLEACNKQERFAHLGAPGINAALLYVEGDAPCSQHVLHAAVGNLCSSSIWQTPAFASCLHYKIIVHGDSSHCLSCPVICSILLSGNAWPRQKVHLCKLLHYICAHSHSHLIDSADTNTRQQLLLRRLAELHAVKQCKASLEGTITLSKQWELEQSTRLLQSLTHVSNCAGDYTRCVYNAALTELTNPLLADYAVQMTASAQHVATCLLFASKSGAEFASSFPIVLSLVDVVENLVEVVGILDSSKSDEFLETTEKLKLFEAISDWQGRANSVMRTIIELPRVTVHRIYAEVIAKKHLPYTDAERLLMSLLDRRGKEAVSRHNEATAAFSAEVMLHKLMTATRQAAPKHDSVPDWSTFSDGLLTDESKHRAQVVAFLTPLGIADLDKKLGSPIEAAHLMQELGLASQAYDEAAGKLVLQQHSEPPPCTGDTSSQTAARSSSNFSEPQATLNDLSQSAQISQTAVSCLLTLCSPDLSADKTRKAAKDYPFSDALKIHEMAGTMTSTAVNAGSNNLSAVDSSASGPSESSIVMPKSAAGAVFQSGQAGNSKLRPSAPPQHSRLHRLISRQAGPFDPVDVALLRPVD